MELTVSFFAVAVPAVVFAGVSKGGFGSGVAFGATALLALILEPAQALGLLLPLFIVMDVASLRPFWRQWHWPSVKVLVGGGVPGVALGIALWRVADPDLLRLLIGVVALSFVAFQAARAIGLLRPATRPWPPAAGLGLAALSGFTSFISHAGGPAAAVYLLSRGLTKTEFQATTVIAFFAVNLMKLVAYASLGIFDRPTLMAAAILVPAALAGVALGVWLHRAVSGRLFFALTYIFLVLAGGKLILDALG